MKKIIFVVLVAILFFLIIEIFVLYKKRSIANNYKKIITELSIKDKEIIEKRSGRKIKLSNIDEMFYNALKIGDKKDFVMKVIYYDKDVKEDIINRNGRKYSSLIYDFNNSYFTKYSINKIKALYLLFDDDDKLVEKKLLEPDIFDLE